MPYRSFSRIESLESRRLLTVLTFDPDGLDGAILPQAYGDRAQGASGGSFEYGTAGGATPNVRVSYGPLPDNIRQHRDGYGDFHNNIYPHDDAGGILDIYLVADLGFVASLTSLELAGKGSDYTINSVSVFDGASNPLFVQDNVEVAGDGIGSNVTTVEFDNLQSRLLRIRIDASNLGADGDQIGIDNVQFSQVKAASDVGDGFADAVLDYHDSGTGGIQGPYGGNDANEGGVPVGLGVVLGDDGSAQSYLSLPTGSYVVVGFVDEAMVAGPGDSLAITELVDTGERAQVYVSSDAVNFTFVGIARSGRTSKFSLSSANITSPIRAVKIVGMDAAGGSPGFDLLGVQVIASAMEPVSDGGPVGSVFAEFSDTALVTVSGTEGADGIRVTALGGALDVTRNGTTLRFDGSITERMEIYALGGNDLVELHEDSPNTYVFGAGGNDTINGGGGRDTLTGGAGKNRIFGFGGDDRLNGSGAPDLLVGGDGDDRLYGNDGDDILSGEAGVDRLFGGNGNDSLSGGSSNDKLYGEAGNDTLSGDNQNDLMEGGSGNDLLIGGKGIDSLFGNAGSDDIEAFDLAADVIDGGSGADRGRVDEIDSVLSIETFKD